MSDPAASDELVLASASPRRHELLLQIGVAHRVLPLDLDESRLPGETAEAYVRRVALDKARAGHARTGGWVLGADTTVVVDGEPLGKPRDRDDALAMLARLAGREHRVLSAVALVTPSAEGVRLSVSRVRFRAIPPDEALAYWQSGEPADKAGGYAIQGRGALFVESLDGSYSGVMGLPLFETGELLRALGHPALSVARGR